MIIQTICTGVVLTLIVGVLVALLSAYVSWASGEPDQWGVAAFLFSTVGFGVCLTILLYKSGLIF